MVMMIHVIDEILIGDSGIGKGIITHCDQEAYEEDDVLDGDDVHDTMKIMKLKMIVTMNTMMMLRRRMMLNADDDIDYDTNSSSGCVASWPG